MAWLKVLMTLFFCTFLPILVFADANVVLPLVDSITLEELDSIYVTLKAEDYERRYFIEEGEKLKIFLEEGVNHLELFVDQPTTPGNDFYTKVEIEKAKESLLHVIYLSPGASAQGFVQDERGNAISGAEVKINCNSQEEQELLTDQFGSFTVEFVPQGSCTVYALSSDRLAFEQLTVSQGEELFLDLKLEHSVIEGGTSFFLPLLSISFIFLFYLFLKPQKVYLTLKRRFSKTKTHYFGTKKISKDLDVGHFSLGRRAHDIVMTLRENEKKIVTALLEEKKELSFTSLRYRSGLSKSSLFRNLQTLEQKNIVKTIRDGKLRKIKFSNWFLERGGENE